MLFDQLDEVFGPITRKRRFRKMWIPRDEIVRAGVNVGEIASAATGDENLLADAIGPLKDKDASSSFSRLNGAHQAGGARSENDGVVCLIHAG